MITLIRFAVVVSTCGLLAACASMGGSASMPPSEQPRLTPTQHYIAYVEQNAKRRGIQLMWINPPRTEEITASR
jgi:hypothetical protein